MTNQPIYNNLFQVTLSDITGNETMSSEWVSGFQQIGPNEYRLKHVLWQSQPDFDLCKTHTSNMTFNNLDNYGNVINSHTYPIFDISPDYPSGTEYNCQSVGKIVERAYIIKVSVNPSDNGTN